ncbi:hypothetical protein [Vibrio hangzhouensis]|uniref:hypothetical protein n=1 Tax=Vibrio hangzhouensis TaxID=462991 RepID=UPI001C978C82|nr:hypothetical protein [Vibrio hangzhouensis]MBY6195606.1 hypothetical protein [Vibrio hangzhouensis]
MMRSRTLVTILSIMLSPFIQASSPDAWDAFRQNVAIACTDKAGETLSDIQLNVDPFGNEDHGIAVLFGKARETAEPMVYVCLYDKHTQKANLYAESRLAEFEI